MKKEFELFHKTDKVKIFDEEFTIAERSGRQESTLASALVGKDINNPAIDLGAMLCIVRDGLQINIIRLPWWKVFEKLRLKRLFSNKSLINLPIRLRLQIVLRIYELEGKEIDLKANEVKKKAVGQ